MSLLSTLFVRSLSSLLLSVSITAQTNIYSLTVSEEACELDQNAYMFIAPFLEDDEAAIYANDTNFISEFPFSSYELIAVPFQGTFYVNDIDDTIKNFLRSGLCWEPKNRDIISQYVKPGSVALDIGAHIGTHTVTMSRWVGENGMVLAFEPGKVIHRELTYNLLANGCTNTYPIRAAIGKSKGIVDVIISHPRNQGGSYVVDSRGGADTSILLPLDSFNLNNVSFMKIDVENMEADVLDGAKSTITRNKPIILIEIQGNGERPVQLNEDTNAMALISIEKIKQLGYSLYRLENSADYLAFPEN